jgi:hypothetical protein
MTMPSSEYQVPIPKAGIVQRRKDRTSGRANAVVQAHLEPGEHMLLGARVHTGPSDWWRLVPRFGELVRFFQRHYFLVLTDRRAIFCRLSIWTARPKNVKLAVPSGQVQVSDYKPGTMYPSFRLHHPGRNKPMKLRSQRAWRPEVEQLLGRLMAGSQAGLPAPGYDPYQVTGAGYQPAPQQQYPPQQQYQAPQQQYQQQQYQQPQQQYQQQPQQYQQQQQQQYQQPQQYQQQQYQQPPSPGSTGRGRHAGG